MKTKKYKVTLEVKVKKTIYVEACNKQEAKFLAYGEMIERVGKKPMVEGEYVSADVKNAEIVPLASDEFNIFGSDYGL